MESWTLELNGKLLYEAQPRQNLFHDAEGDEVLYGGQAGGGKSKAIIADAIGFAIENKGVRVGLFRRTYPELAKSLVIELQKTLPYGFYHYNKTEKVAELPNGSRLEFNYCQNESDVYHYQSTEYDRLYFDEVTHFTRFQYTYLVSRLRTTKQGIKPQVKCGSNPGNVGHMFVKDRFIDGAIPEQLTERFDSESGRRFTTMFIPASIDDNKYILQNDPTYKDRLLSLPEKERRMLLEGDWDVFSGQVFSEWRRSIHIIEPIELKPEWNRFISLDWGYNAPHCALWYCVTPERRIYIYRELYGTQKTDEQLAKEIVELSQGEKIAYRTADPSIWSKSSIGESIADRMARVGAAFNAADNDRKSGLARVHSYLSLAPDKKPWIQIFSTCTNLIDTLPGLIYDAHKIDDVDTTGDDHAYDSLRYGLMSRPHPNAPSEVKPPKNSFESYLRNRKEERFIKEEYVGY